MKLTKIITEPLFIMYRYLISPVLGVNCRFEPSCSRYAHEAYEKHNFFKASWLTFWRLLRCNPWGGQGYDPVPKAKEKAKHKCCDHTSQTDNKFDIKP